jgi:hypothetical protein
MFPEPWYSKWCGDCWRIFDANDRHLFVIAADEFSTVDEDPKTGTVFTWTGTRAEQEELAQQIEHLFPEKGESHE